MLNNIDVLESYILNLNEPTDHIQSVEQFRTLYELVPVQTWLVKDLSFDICNFIMRHRPELLSLAIRINVQVNLFLRTIEKYANNPQEILDKIGHKLGCFALTEEDAGVLSGLIIETKFKEEENSFVLTTLESSKNWISQGMYADCCIVYASNIENDRDVRIFLIDMDNHHIEKTAISSLDISKSLDLAKITFHDLKIPSNNLLNKSTQYTKINLLDGIFFGRYMIAEATVSAILGLVDHIRITVNEKQKVKRRFESLGFIEYLDACESEYEKYRHHLAEQRQRVIFDENDLFKTNCYKIYVVEKSIAVFNKLTMMFGLKAATWKLKYSNLILHKIAEGDTYVLRMSLIHNLQREGKCAVFTKAGFTLADLFIMTCILSTKKEVTDYVISNFKEISDRIIFSNIPLILC